MSLNCRIAGCRRKPHAHGLCQQHYDQQRKTQAKPEAGAAAPKKGKAGKAPAAKPVAVPAAAVEVDDKNCSVPGCTNPHHARGYCKSHYGQLRRRGHIEEIPATPNSPVAAVNKERRLAEIMKRHELLKKEIANIHKELESEVDED